MFISPETFERRLDHLRRCGIPIVSLEIGLSRLAAEGARTPFSIALTFDDGFHNFSAQALPRLLVRHLPATVYVTTYHVRHPRWPVFDLAVDYMLWARSGRVVPGALIAERDPLDCSDLESRERAADRIYAHADADGLDGAGKEALLGCLARELAFPYDELVSRRQLCMMSADEVRDAATAGVDIQMHTHRHHIPPAPDEFTRELADNRSALAEIGVHDAAHFCYPNGTWSEWMWATLRRNDVRSATTCEPGVVSAESPPYALPRFLDSESVTQLEFEAWTSGFLSLAARLRRRSNSDPRP